ncbi:phosphoglucomutase [Petrotoga sibirica DSM 13575]|uniref:Phosphoglucomutase/phosphomannomutase n=2 Tax=Petrotoga sibirica TaxID=156202 RepID=A0A4R8F4V1_9BACT|nr:MULTISPECIES: phospho-sugar mutase [Petrotoga]POZ88099.1 phosphoglucomutase [Petrotoga sibirica DSM 13575]POZ90189.1 phosphoglucomutase [Petrotoga sp. SL27]TDX17201.1 phosphoglucomutase/phosphomannomutase [Petrotoga sibirica]
MRDYKKIYYEWLNSPYIDERAKEELKSIENNLEEIEERFYKDLEFGTAGLRGKLGIGTNMMNIYTVGRASQALADYITDFGEERMKMGVVIAYDVRHFSKEFAKESALILAANGVKAYLFDDIRPTPVLSFAVRYLKTTAGIVVTASHNPKDYNGYKVYWDQGSQILDDVANGIVEKIEKIGYDFSKIKKISEKEAISQNLLQYISKEVDEEYIQRVESLALRDEDVDKNITIVYTPLNGTSNIFVRRVLKDRGFKNVFIVKEQELPDPDFKSVANPNPEYEVAFEEAKKLGYEKNAHLLLANDPDGDRTALEILDDNNYKMLNGNQVGALLVNYILESKSEKGCLEDNSVIIKSIVTGDLTKRIAKKYNVDVIETLTGFKNICGKENELEKEGKKNFLFGFEESIGYITGTFVRDKDGIIASMLISEMAGYYSKKNKNLIDVLEDIYQEFGYELENNYSLVLEGVEGQERIKRIMEKFRNNFPKEMGDLKLEQYADYLKRKLYNLTTGEINNITDIPSSDVLRFWFNDGSWYAIRPSGTEPKLKIYIYSNDKEKEKAQAKLDQIKNTVDSIIENVV